jgi:hypothetical protein
MEGNLDLISNSVNKNYSFKIKNILSTGLDTPQIDRPSDLPVGSFARPSSRP